MPQDDTSAELTRRVLCVWHHPAWLALVKVARQTAWHCQLCLGFSQAINHTHRVESLGCSWLMLHLSWVACWPAGLHI
eukprot:scaffold337073_cov54-Prasinocladus_malaysianus.AAC.1